MSPSLTKAKKPPAAWNDTRLVKACLAGDEEAWSVLIDKYKALIYSIPARSFSSACPNCANRVRCPSG